MSTEIIAIEDLTPNQERKRLLAVQSAIRIVGTVTADGVAMKDVSSDSGVALATLYRFFSSRDHLLAAALVEWHGSYVRHQRANAQRGVPHAERIYQHLRVGFRAFERNPNYLSLALLPSFSTDEHASREVYRVRMDSINLMTDLLADLGPERAAIYAQMIEACQVDHLMQWMTGRLTHIAALDMLRRQLDLLFT